MHYCRDVSMSKANKVALAAGLCVRELQIGLIQDRVEHISMMRQEELFSAFESFDNIPADNYPHISVVSSEPGLAFTGTPLARLARQFGLL